MAAAAAEKVVAYHTVSIDSTSINFPFQPYELQIEYMRKVLECVREGRKEDIPPSSFSKWSVYTIVADPWHFGADPWHFGADPDKRIHTSA